MFKHKCHPDLGGNEEDARKINEAYQVLSDPDDRKKYDSTLGPEIFRSARSSGGERRKVPRVYTNLTVSFKPDGGVFEPAKIADISSLGCRLQTKSKLGKGDRITVDIAGHKLEGVVRWNRMFHPSVFQRVYEQGIEFIREFEDIDRIKL